MAEGNMSESDSASSRSVRRSRRPQSTPRHFTHENRETSETPVAQSSSRSAGEGKSRTTGVYGFEGAHRGLVPLNHSNQNRCLLAGDEEGRLVLTGRRL